MGVNHHPDNIVRSVGAHYTVGSFCDGVKQIQENKKAISSLVTRQFCA